MSNKVTQQSDVDYMKAKLLEYKSLIDDDIKSYTKEVENVTLKNYGASARLVADSYLEILARGGKRLRGALVMHGYAMSGGKNQQMIIQAARATEMIHAYLLIMDDIQDRSVVRRGGPTIPVSLAAHHKEKHLSGSAEHFGLALSLNAMGIGNHAAQVILANIDAPAQLRLNVISILNRTLLVTAHGQTNDIMNEVVASADDQSVERVMEWKTAHYTILNPLHMGMVLAGADCHATDAITEYAIHTGKAFQITDDILGVFGTEFDSGKSPMDDIKEGKRTVLSNHALTNAGNADKNFLLQMLGNSSLTQAEFERCKEIIKDTGALDVAKSRATEHIQLALIGLQNEQDRWSKDGVRFLRGLAGYLVGRTS